MRPFRQLITEGTVEKQEFIEKMSPVHSLTKRPYNRLNVERYRIEVEAALVQLGVPAAVAKDIYAKATQSFSAQNRSGVMLYTPIGEIYNELKRRRLAEAAQFKVGDQVHLGFGSKGGAGFEGEIVKLDGDTVYIRNKWHRGTQRGPVKFLTKL
jgi:hypothetical protein